MVDKVSQSAREQELEAGFGRTAVTVGTFDGLHRGHGRIISTLVERSAAAGLEPVAVTFDPHPRMVLQPEAGTRLLSLLRCRLRMFAELGLEKAVVLGFTPGLSRLDPEEFVRRYLIGRYGMRMLVVGYDHGFGRERSGGGESLQKLSASEGFELVRVQPVVVDGSPVSSSRIRRAVAGGQMPEAAALLGRHYGIAGRVVRGRGRGKDLGHPTANIELLEPEQMMFPEGIYAAAVDLDGRVVRGALHYGPRPTYGEPEPTIELNIFDFSGDLYGRLLEILVIERIRPIMRFDSPDELRRQMDRDDREIERVFSRTKLPNGGLSRAL